MTVRQATRVARGAGRVSLTWRDVLRGFSGAELWSNLLSFYVSKPNSRLWLNRIRFNCVPLHLMSHQVWELSGAAKIHLLCHLLLIALSPPVSCNQPLICHHWKCENTWFANTPNPAQPGTSHDQQGASWVKRSDNQRWALKLTSCLSVLNFRASTRQKHLKQRFVCDLWHSWNNKKALYMQEQFSNMPCLFKPYPPVPNALLLLLLCYWAKSPGLLYDKVAIAAPLLHFFCTLWRVPDEDLYLHVMEPSEVMGHTDLSGVYEMINDPAPRSHVGREEQLFVFPFLTKGARPKGGGEMGREVMD